MKRLFPLFITAVLAWAGSANFDEARKLYQISEFQKSLQILREVPDKDAATWERRLMEQDVACVEVYEANFAAFANTDPAFRESFMVEVEHPVFDKHLRHGPMVSFSVSPARLGTGCQIGQHTREILGELGYEVAAIEALKERGVVTWPG